MTAPAPFVRTFGTAGRSVSARRPISPAVRRAALVASVRARQTALAKGRLARAQAAPAPKRLEGRPIALGHRQRDGKIPFQQRGDQHVGECPASGSASGRTAWPAGCGTPSRRCPGLSRIRPLRCCRLTLVAGQLFRQAPAAANNIYCGLMIFHIFGGCGFKSRVEFGVF